MPARLIVAYVLIALLIAAAGAGIAYLRHNSRKNVMRRERERRGY